ncbi:MAG: pilin [Candidatus Aenigmatarchaeota archaeon]
MKKIIIILIILTFSFKYVLAQENSDFYSLVNNINTNIDNILKTQKKYELATQGDLQTLRFFLNVNTTSFTTYDNINSFLNHFLVSNNNPLVFCLTIHTGERNPFYFYERNPKTKQQNRLILIFDNKNQYWKNRINEEKYEALEYYYKEIQKYKDKINNFLDNYEYIRNIIKGEKGVGLELITTLKDFKNKLDNIENFKDFINSCASTNQQDEEWYKSDPNVLAALQNLSNMIAKLKEILENDNFLLAYIAPGSSPYNYNPVCNECEKNVNCYFYSFEDFDKNYSSKIQPERINIVTLAAGLNNANSCKFWTDQNYSNHIANNFEKDAKEIKLTISEYGGKIEVEPITIPIAIKPSGIFNKLFSEITPEDIFNEIKDFLFNISPYIFVILLTIGGLLYLFTPISDQIKKGSEIIKWAIIGYFLLLIITGIVFLLKSILGG